MTRRKGAARDKGREVPFAEDGQDYAKVVTMLGNRRVKAKFLDGTERTCRIRGSMSHRDRVRVGDTVLVAFRTELATDVADIVFKYAPHEVAWLRLDDGGTVDIAADEEELEMDKYVTFGGDDLELDMGAI